MNFTPSAFSQCSDMTQVEEETSDVNKSPKDILNSFLASRDVSPIRTSMATSWDAAAGRTKRHYIRKAKQVVHAVLKEISPENSEQLLGAMQSENKESDDMDSSLLEALVECYENADHWSSGRQFLSIIVDKVTFPTLQKWIPNLSYYYYKIAMRHLIQNGRGAKVEIQKQTRMKVHNAVIVILKNVHLQKRNAILLIV